MCHYFPAANFYFSIFALILVVKRQGFLLAVFLSRGLYLTSIFYRDDNVLVTPEDQIPVVEIEDSYSSSLMQDFLWFTKVENKKLPGGWGAWLSFFQPPAMFLS